MNISLTPELERFVEDEVATGMYSTGADVVREALRMLEETKNRSATDRAEFDQMITSRMAEADLGDFVDVDAMWADFDQLARQRQVVQA